MYPSEPYPILGDVNYEHESLSAPAATGTKLAFLAYWMTDCHFGFISGLITRLLLTNNKLHVMRELSSQIPDPPLAFPMYHMTTEEREVYDANYRVGEHEHKDETTPRSETSINDGILELLTEYRNESSLAEYYFAYLEKRTTPPRCRMERPAKRKPDNGAALRQASLQFQTPS